MNLLLKTNKHSLMYSLRNLDRYGKKICYFFCVLCIQFLWNSTLYAQNRTLTGTVKTESGQALQGASIMIKGSSQGTSTNIDGSFSLVSTTANPVLVVSYQGYVTQEITINANQNSLDIVLVSNNSQTISEVVVTGFGLSQKKESLTSAISTLSEQDLSRSVSSTTSGAVVGKIAGINSRQVDGRPGAGTALQIRNMGNPLYVIDGVQKDAGQFNNLDFNDIESISVLKDASAAIYGVRAANGVIVVTTKKGKLNAENTINIIGNYGFQNLAAFAKPASVNTYIQNYIQSETIQGKSSYTYSKEDFEKWTQGTEKGFRPFDWYDYIWETSPQQYISANTSGGSEKINYYFSIGHLNQDAMIVNYGGFKRSNIQMNVESQITSKLKVGASVNGRYENRTNPGVPGSDDYWLPIFATYRNLPTKRPFANDNPLYPTRTSTDPGTNFGWLNYDLSGKYTDTWRVAQLNANAEYNLMDGLKAKALIGYYFANQKLDNHEFTYKLYEYRESDDTYPVIFENNNPWRERRMGYVEELTSNIQLNYAKTFNSHSINALVGFETIQRNTPTTWVHSIPTSNSLTLIDYQTMDTYDDIGNNTQGRIGYMARANYDYEGKYLVELSGRYDGSWKFPPNHRWGFFPAASVGWRMSAENFWKNSALQVLNDFKIRASYGLLGDDEVAGYSAFGYMPGFNYKTGGSVIDGEYVLGSQPRGLPVTTLSWIRAKVFDIGLDFSLINSKLSGTIDYFRRIRTGLPASRYDILLPSEVGFALPSENLNSDVIKGMDGMIKWTDQVGELNYSVGANVTYSRFYDWNQYKPRFSNSWNVYRNSINERYGYINWGLVSDGQFQTWDEIANWQIDNDRQGNKTLRPGDVKYVDQNGDGVINGLDERPIGYRQDSTPIFNYGLNFSFSWKNFDLAFDLSGSALNTYFMEWEQRNPFHDGGNNAQYYMENSWKLADIYDANSELIPGKYPMLLIGNSNHSNYWNSDFWKTTVKYIKLRNLEFGYAIPSEWTNKINIKRIRLYFSGQNLLTFSNLPGLDPEIQATNGLAYPTTRIMNFGINLTL
ncbi:SusC/RagA family TonB-linked outer membrane protein [Sphingobacterium sp. HJSM2_6]|uniref:SusC/RagA family TonB-linked outer membrane protein n=1 Tax=Sphingobacterium sp. HJSM2_6 TaxID=3366264 RepID=UPI003BC597A3